MKNILWIMIVISVGLWAYNAGTLSPAIQNDKIMIGKNYKEVQCNDIKPDEQRERLICAVDLEREDDNIRIFRGEYGE